MKLCSIVGQLIRHATVIENELSQLGIPTVLTEVMRDKSEKVKRKAIAALGEYLFYGATQMDEENGNVVTKFWITCIINFLCLERMGDKYFHYCSSGTNP